MVSSFWVILWVMDLSIEELLTHDEGKTLEFKENTKPLAKIIQTIVAFANTAGGTLVIGVRNRSKEIVGLSSALDEEERLASSIADAIAPGLFPNIYAATYRNKELLIIDVAWSSGIGPCYVRTEGKESGSYIRLGSTNRRADSATIVSIERLRENKYFDEMPAFDAHWNDLDGELAAALFSGRRWSLEKALAMKLMIDHQRIPVASLGGILLLGIEKTRQRTFPDALVRCGRFKGKTKSIIIDEVRIASPLPTAVKHILQFIERHTSVAIEIKGLEHRQVREYPMSAVREAVVNAVVHADYSVAGASIEVCIFDDRIEITNSGALPFGLTLEAALNGRSRLRNPVIGRFFREIGFIEAWGSGLRRMIDTCETAGLQAPHFLEEGAYFSVKLFNAHQPSKVIAKMATRYERRLAWVDTLLYYLKEHRTIAPKEAKTLWNITARATSSRLKRLCSQGLIVEIGTSPFDPYKKFSLKN